MLNDGKETSLSRSAINNRFPFWLEDSNNISLKT